jgi:hypothetical protein
MADGIAKGGNVVKEFIEETKRRAACVPADKNQTQLPMHGAALGHAWMSVPFTELDCLPSPHVSRRMPTRSACACKPM